MPPTASPTEQLQRRTLGTLVTTQVLGGVGTAGGITVMALLTERVSGSEALAGLGTTSQILGGALLAVPVARVSAAHGRRPGLALGYGIAAVGAAIVILAAAQGALQLVGLVISIHILGMYALSPLVGAAVDRAGPRPVAAAGGVLLVLACALAAPVLPLSRYRADAAAAATGHPAP